MTFMPLALARTAQEAIENIAILTLQNPQPARREGGPTAVGARVLEGDEFTVSRQLSK